MNAIIEKLELIAPMSAAFRKALTREFMSLSLPKHHLLLEEGQIAENAYFIKDGFAMSYRTIEEKKQIEEFYNKGRIILSPKSFFEQVPSEVSIELLSTTDVYYIRQSSVMLLLENFQIARHYSSVIMNRYYEEGRQRIHDFQLLNAFDRYHKFRKTYPKLEQLVPQEHIASYLGIVPQSLSRIKRTYDGA